jgi:exonuclease SbcC
MIPVRLSLKNFLCYRDQVPILDLEGVHVACLCGQNGHGKSALLDAITWALWGEARGRRHDDLIYHGERDMQVVLEFEARATQYRVVRRHARTPSARQGQSSLDLLVATGDGFRPITGNSIGETQRQINHLLSMDYTTFVNSAFLMQGRADEFTRSTPAQRKEVLASVLVLGLYDRLEERAKSKARDRSIESRSMEMERERLLKEVSEKPGYLQEMGSVQLELEQTEAASQEAAMHVESLRLQFQQMQTLRRELEALQKQIQDFQEEISRMQAQARARQVSLNQYRQKAERVPHLKKQLGELESRLDAIEQEGEKLQHKKTRLQDAKQEAHLLRSENDRLKREMEELRKKVDMLLQEDRGARCPLCDSHLAEEGCQHLAQNYEIQGRELASAYRVGEVTLKQLEAEVDKLESDLSQTERRLRENRRVDDEHRINLIKEIQEAVTIQNIIPSEEEALRTEEGLIKFRKLEMEETQNRSVVIGRDLEGMPSLEREFQGWEKSLDDLHRHRDLLRDQSSRLEDRIGRCEQQELQLKKLEEDFQSIQREVSIYRDLAEAFGKKGVQALLIEASITRLEEEANRLLARMTDHRLTVKLQTQRERRTRKDAEPMETLDILVADELGTRDYQMFSGGEAFRINFALRVALSRLLAERSGAPLPTLFVDEGFGTQDASGRESVLDVIRAIQDDFKRILVITHMEEIKEAFLVRIEVSKGPRGSTFVMS